MGRGASYRPQYAIDCLPPQAPVADVWCYGGDPSQYNRQGDHGSRRSQSFDAYATVDAWRSYHEDKTSLTEQYTGRTMNPAASEFSPPVALANHLQLQSNPHFKPYEPLRLSSGTSEAQLVKSFWNSGLNSSVIENRRNYSTMRVPEDESIQRSSHERPLPSIEPGTDYSLKAQVGLDESRRNSGRRSTPRRTPHRTILPPVAPEASGVYLTQARLPPVRRSTPKKCLIILDLNGTCIARPNLYEPKVFKVRPGIHKLFDYLFEHHVVMIFTSMHPKNATAIVEKLFTSSQRERLAAFWARDKLGLTSEQLHSKTQTYKNLIPIWLDRAIQSTHPMDEGRWGWDQSNTILIDDSHLKAVSHPHNLLLVPEFAKKNAAKHKLHPVVERSEEAILQSLILKLEELKYQNDVSRLILQWQIGKAQIPQEPQSSLVMENKVTTPSTVPVQLLTPESTVDPLSENSQDDEIHLKLSAQMKALDEDDELRTRGVSEIPDTTWADLLQGSHTKS